MCIALSLLFVGTFPSEGNRFPLEYEVKAAYLYNFANFVEWPADAFPDPDEPFIVAILGIDPFGTLMEQAFSGRKLLDRETLIVRTDRPETAAAAHLVFIAASEADDMPQILRALSGRSVLSVGDEAEMARHGTVIGFRLDERKVRFDINPERAERARLRLSSQLLKLARIVGDESR